MFVIAGESLIDLVPGTAGTLMPVPGGGPYNFARALALQGVPAGYLNPFSEDAFGALLGTALKAAGAAHLGGTSRYPTSLALVTSDEHGKPHYSFYRERIADRDVALPALVAAAAALPLGFHTGGLALVPPDDAMLMEAVRHFRTRGVLCTVDVNMRPYVADSMGVSAGQYRDAALAIVSACHVAKVSDEDLRHLGFSGAPQVAARALLHRGCRLVVLTLGSEGAWAISAEEQVFRAAHQVEAVDTVGAGDCFFAGFVGFLHRYGALQDLRERAPPAPILGQALQHAAACAAINIGRKGCAPPSWEEAAHWRGGQ
jgi:fructokinase